MRGIKITKLPTQQDPGKVKLNIPANLQQKKLATSSINFDPKLGINIPNEYKNTFDLRPRPKVPVNQNVFSDFDFKKMNQDLISGFAAAESTMPANMFKAPIEWEGLSGPQIIAMMKERAAYDALPEALKRRDELSADTRSDTEKFARQAWTAISHPMETISAVSRGYDIPSGYMGMGNPYEGYGVGSPMTSVVDFVAGAPAFIANAGYRQGEQIVNNPGEYALGQTLGLFDPKYRGQAVSNYMDLGAAIPASRMAAGPLGKFLTTKTPLKNAYRYNPRAWKPNSEAYYHRSPDLENIINLENGTLQGFGQSAEGAAYNELAIPGKGPGFVTDKGVQTGLNLRKAAHSENYFSKGVPLDFGRYNKGTQGYRGPYLAEVEGVPFVAKANGKFTKVLDPVTGQYTRGIYPPSVEGGYAVAKGPIPLPNAKFYKEHWLKGYKPVDMDKQLDLTSLYRIEPKGKTFPSFADPYDPGYIDWSMPISELHTDPTVAKMLLDDPKTWNTVDWGEVMGIGANGDRRIAQYYPQSAEGNWWSTDHPNVNNHMFPTIDGNEALQMMEIKVPRKILPQYQSLAVSPAYGNPRPDEFILPTNRRQGAKITDWERPKKAQGGDISVPDLRRVKISKLPKAQDGKAVGNMANYINQTFGWDNQEPQQSYLDYFYNIGKQKPQSGFDYNTYMNYANKYLGRDTFKGTTLTAKDLADAAQEFYNSTNYVYPVDLLLAQGQMETKLGKTLKSKNNYFNVGNTDEGATRDFKSGKDSALDYMNLMYNDYMNKGQKTPEQLLAPNSFVNYQGNRYASNPNYETDVANQRQFIKKYLGVKKEGGSLPEAQFGLGDKIFKKRVLNQYPTMQNIYGPKGENLNIIKDKNFNASDYGYGDIEFIFPGDGAVTYSDDYTYQSPTPDKYTAVYNPKGARRGDVFLDMLHGMRNDPGYEQLLQNFGNSVKDARGEDMQYFYEKDLLEGYAGDGQERWDDNYIDGLLRSELYKNAPGKVSAKKDYELERTESSPQMQTAAKDLYDYLRTAPKKVGQKKQGGAVKRVKINGLPKNWKTK